MPASTLRYSAFGLSFKRAAMTLSLLILIQCGVPERVHAADTVTPLAIDTTDQGEALWSLFGENNRRSNNLRLRILFSQGGPVERQGGYGIEEFIPFDDLLEAARGSTDALVFAMLLDRCERVRIDAPARCDRIDLARRWVAADTQNQVAWIALATALADEGDLQGARAAWTSAALASTFRDDSFEAARTIVRALPRELTPIQRYLALRVSTIVSMGPSGLAPLATAGRVYRSCKDPALRSECLRIARTMLRDANNLATLNMAGRLVDRLDPADLGHRDRAETVHAVYWGLMNDSTDDEQAIDAGDAGAIERASRDLEFRLEHGEIAAARKTLRRLGVSEAEAAKRFLDAHPERSALEARSLEDARQSAGTATK